jgi:hypothetical protein
MALIILVTVYEYAGTVCTAHVHTDKIKFSSYIRCFAQLCANFSSNPRRIHSGQKDKEKEEYGLLCVAICCGQPPLPISSPPPTLRTILPACGCVYQD